MANNDIDQALIDRVKRGDREAFGLLVSKYQRRIFRLLSRFIRDRSEVEDVAQEAFIKAYRALPSFRGESAFYTWLYRIAINTAKNWLSANRRAAVSLSSEDGADEDWALAAHAVQTETPETLMASRQVGEAIGRAFAQLPEELATAIQLREVDGLSYEEIAQVMGCPVGTVRSRLFRAREAIAAQMRPLIDAPKDKRW